MGIIPKFVCIAGENSIGKTTLINWINKTKSIDQIELNKNNSFFILHTDINEKIRTDYPLGESITLDNIEQNVITGYEEKMIDGSTVNKEYLTGRRIIDIFKKIKEETVDLIVDSCLKENKNLQTEIQNTFLMKFQNFINNNLLKDKKIDFLSRKCLTMNMISIMFLQVNSNFF